MPSFRLRTGSGLRRSPIWLIVVAAALWVVVAVAAPAPVSGVASPATRVHPVMNAADYPTDGAFLDPSFTTQPAPASTLTMLDADLITLRCWATPVTPLPLAWGTDTVWYIAQRIDDNGTGWLSAHFVRGAVPDEAIGGVPYCPDSVTPPSFDTPEATDALLFGPLSVFRQARTLLLADGLLDWSSDDCSAPLPEPTRSQPHGFDFREPCQRHDFGYRNDIPQHRLTEDVRKRIDENLKNDLYAVCDSYTGWQAYRGVECRRIADVYNVAVRSCGQNPAEFCPDRIMGLFDFLR